MRVTFSEIFDREIKTKFGISREFVRHALEKPIAQSNINIDNIEFVLFIEHVSFSTQEYYLLVIARKEDDKLFVDLAFKILPSLINDIRTIEPIVVLQEFAQRFGLSIRIGNQLNKFIIGEEVLIDDSSEADEIVEIVNPYNHSFINTINIMIEEVKNQKVLKCRFVYCIDTDKYSEWLVDKDKRESINGQFIVEINPQIKGHYTINDLITSSGTIVFNSNYSEICNDKSVNIFKLLTDSYHFKLGFAKDHFFIQRNSDLLKFPLHTIYKPDGRIQCYAMWNPTSLSLLILDETYQEAILQNIDPNFSEQEVEKRTKTIKTSTTFPPNYLINGIRKSMILSETTYESIADFNNVVTLMIQSIGEKISTIGLRNPFWNIIYDGKKIKNRTPKHETEIHSTIHSLLYDQAIAKNIQIIPESPIAGGNLDFQLSGILKNNNNADVCVEFKLAHSNDIINGLTKQLPAYMHAKGCDYGIYCVLWFKGSLFPSPSKYNDVYELEFDLHTIIAKNGLNCIRIIILDVSEIITPSKLKD